METIDLIIDTDIGSDSDDVGALMIAHKLKKRGECNILAVTASVSRRDAACAIDVINRYYGEPNIPVGILTEKKCGENPPEGCYSRALEMAYENSYASVNAENATKVLRRVLANAKNKVRIVTIGSFANIAYLLKSQPDEISTLNGVDLVKEKVLDMYSMAGNFSEPITEWNVKIALEESLFVAKNFPLPITYCPFEVGNSIFTGKKLMEGGNSPMKTAYYVFGHIPRQSWDPITIFCAIRGEEEFCVAESVKVEMDQSGITTIDGKGKDRVILSAKDKEKLTQTLENLIC